MNKNLIIAIVLAVLVLISIVQAVQLNSLRTKVSEIGTTGTSSQKVSVGSGSDSSGPQGTALPSNIQNLPQMVGGC